MKDQTSPEEFGLLFKRFLDDIVNRAEVPEGPLLKRLREHLGGEPMRMPVISEEFERFQQPNLQVAMDAYLERPGNSAELIGLAAENKRNWGLGLSDFVNRGTSPYSLRLAEGPVDWVNFHLDGDRVLPVVQFGLYLMKADGVPLVAFVSGPNENMGPTRARARVEVMAAERANAQRFLADITKLMGERNVYRGKIVSLGPQQFGFGPQTIITFHRLPAVARDDVILPSGILERIDRHAIAFSEHAERLIAAGRPIKRGLLLYGSPGTGKTLTVMYLAGRMKGRTVLLTTGRGLGFIGAVAQMARVLAPSMVVVEDVDLIAQERGMPGMQTQPMLFELLNEMDGLRDDVDVLFVLTTNRPDILEPALAARPGRVDLAVPLPLPDADARRRLFALYGRGLRLEVADLDRFIARTEGASPAYIKELLRNATVFGAIDGDGAGAVRVTDKHLDQAMDELSEGGRLAERIAGFARPGEEGPPAGAMGPSGFPAQVHGGTSWRAG
ncbi:MAG: 26S protease regulatory subunit [Chloroflexi bacterium]|nr:MAG: 26S protease regulatory subunit [Chloroflexota bacterium]